MTRRSHPVAVGSARWCVEDPRAWDLDVLNTLPNPVERARDSLMACLSCPALQACRQDRHRSHVAPRALIWGGEAFNDHGERIAPVDLAAYLRRLSSAGDHRAAPSREAV